MIFKGSHIYWFDTAIISSLIHTTTAHHHELQQFFVSSIGKFSWFLDSSFARLSFSVSVIVPLVVPILLALLFTFDLVPKSTTSSPNGKCWEQVFNPISNVFISVPSIVHLRNSTDHHTTSCAILCKSSHEILWSHWVRRLFRFHRLPPRHRRLLIIVHRHCYQFVRFPSIYRRTLPKLVGVGNNSANTLNAHSAKPTANLTMSTHLIGSVTTTKWLRSAQSFALMNVHAVTSPVIEHTQWNTVQLKRKSRPIDVCVKLN